MTAAVGLWFLWRSLILTCLIFSRSSSGVPITLIRKLCLKIWARVFISLFWILGSRFFSRACLLSISSSVLMLMRWHWPSSCISTKKCAHYSHNIIMAWFRIPPVHRTWLKIWIKCYIVQYLDLYYPGIVSSWYFLNCTAFCSCECQVNLKPFLLFCILLWCIHLFIFVLIKITCVEFVSVF